MQKILYGIVLALSFMCATAEACEPVDVSMIQLIANPQQYDGKPIRLTAFLNLEFEGNALYLHREDFEKSLSFNGVWLSLDDSQIRASRKLSGGYVLVEGVFSAKDRGHFGMFSGTVEKVRRIESGERQKK